MDRNNSTKKFMQYEIGDEANGINYVGYDERRVKPDNKKLLFFCVFPLILLVIGIVLIILAHAKVNSCDDSSQVATENQTSAEDICLYSSEAKRIGLPDFLKNLREVYFDMFPEEIAWKPLVDEVMIKQKFAIHDPRAENIKRITDKAKELLDQAVALVRTLFEQLLQCFVFTTPFLTFHYPRVTFKTKVISCYFIISAFFKIVLQVIAVYRTDTKLLVQGDCVISLFFWLIPLATTESTSLEKGCGERGFDVKSDTK